MRVPPPSPGKGFFAEARRNPALTDADTLALPEAWQRLHERPFRRIERAQRECRRAYQARPGAAIDTEFRITGNDDRATVHAVSYPPHRWPLQWQDGTNAH